MSTVNPRWIIVDDVDPRIQYTGPWFPDQGSQDNVGTYGTPFRSTLHGTISNASFSFAFHGSQVAVYGSIALRNDSGVYDPTWQCFVDDISIETAAPFPANENDWVFCQQSKLVDGPHILTVNATVLKKQTFWFDNIQYVPSADVPLDEEAILVFNMDPQLHYGSGWGSLGGIANMTDVFGSTFSFNFIGVSLTWFGWIPKELPLGPSPATYSIDGQTPINFRLKGLASNISTLYNQVFFETAKLSPGSHSLDVVYQGNNSTPLTYFSLVIQNSTLPSTTTSVGRTSTTGVSTTAGSSVSATSTQGKSSIPVGAITGGVIGGLVLVILAILGVLLLRRRQKRAAEEKIVNSMPEPFNYTPVQPPSNLSSSNISHSQVSQTRQMSSPLAYATKGHTPSSLSASTDTTAQTTNLHQVVPLQQSTNPLLPTPLPIPPAPSLSPFTTKAERQAEALGSQRRGDAPHSMQGNNAGSPNVVVQLHEDSGIRMPQSTPTASVVMDVPPLYTPD